MVRSLRAGLDQYQDPYVQRQLEQIMAQKVPSNPVKGAGYVFDRWKAGQMKRKGQRELGELSKALTEGDENRTTIIPATAGVTEGEAVVDVPGDTGAREGEYAINPTIAGINPESGALYGRKVALGKLLQDNPDSYSAQQALLANNQLLASQDAGLQLQKLGNENAVEAGILKHRRAKELLKFKKGLGINPSGRAASGIQYYDRIQELIKKYGVDSPEVKRMEHIIKTTQFTNTGGAITPFNPMRPTEQIPVTPITLKPADEPFNAARKAQATSGGTKIGTKNAEDYAIVRTAVDQQEDIARLVTHLNSSEAITGVGAEMLKNLARVKAFIGDKVARKKASDTEILDVMMGSEVFPMIKSLGIGARGMDTPAERIFMRKVLTGSLELDRATLIKMAEMRSNLARRRISKWNKRLDDGELNNFYANQNLPKTKFKVRDVMIPQANLNRKNKKLPANKIPDDLVPVGAQ